MDPEIKALKKKILKLEIRIAKQDFILDFLQGFIDLIYPGLDMGYRIMIEDNCRNNDTPAGKFFLHMFRVAERRAKN
jgi:hypothetical protein